MAKLIGASFSAELIVFEVPVSSLRPIEKTKFEELLGMASGYVLDFTNRTFQEFMRDVGGVNIYTDAFVSNGDSKAKRLRAFWEREPDQTVGKVLAGLIEYWTFRNPQPDAAQAATAAACRQIAERLLGKAMNAEDAEKRFLQQDLTGVSLAKLKLDTTLIAILQARLSEANRCVNMGAPLAAIFLCGSVLEGLLLGRALIAPEYFNTAPSAPKDKSGKVRPFHEWTLAQFIEVACELGDLGIDVKKFGHALRDFRNYIHPYQQLSAGFSPDKHTAEICLQVLRAAIASLSGERK